MNNFQDAPRSPLFSSLKLGGNATFARLAELGFSDRMIAALTHAPRGNCIGWGIPFDVDAPVVISDQPVSVEIGPIQTRWLVFMHTSDLRPLAKDSRGIISPMRGEGLLAEHAADYVIRYTDGAEISAPILRRRQVGMFQRCWGENCFEAVPHRKPFPKRAAHEQLIKDWGYSQKRVELPDGSYGEEWVNWLWAWKNPHPEKEISAIRFEPVSGGLIIFGLAAGNTEAHPLRWRTRLKARLSLDPAESFEPRLNEFGELKQIRLDLGQVISATPRLLYPHDTWAETHNNQLPDISENEILVEYAAHPEGRFHLADGRMIPAATVEAGGHETLRPVAPADRRVLLRVKEKDSGREVPVKLHIHGHHGEYLPPVDRHRIPNPAWFEDYSVDFSHQETHFCTYIPGRTRLNLPLGEVYLEVSKGFEIRPVRKVVRVEPDTKEIVVEIEKVLPWREQGWVTADTHVHFLSPATALLEGAAEGVNVVNLLASQWGELMTNVGDFDGRTTWGSEEAGGDGEYLVRVGTENRQHVLGHISLLGYQGDIIAPMTTGGPEESAIGDPVEILLTEWARQCKRQGGLTVLPHFPNPRAEHAAILTGDVDGVEMTSWGDLYQGIDPYSLSDWYRYLNCGYLVAAVGGTDKMRAETPVGAVRTYARLDLEERFSYQAWMEAVRRAQTFVTYGPLLEFEVDGRSMGSRLELPPGGGSLDVTWRAASVTVPMSRVELVVNGEIRESVAVDAWQAGGSWPVKVERSSWLALLVRGHHADKSEIIAAHSSPVMTLVEGSPILAAADAVTILEQLEGSLAYLDTVGTRADEAAYKRMRLVLTSAHRGLHNRLHQSGRYHRHSPLSDHH